MCQLGGDGEYYNHSSCIEGLISKEQNHILASCPGISRSGSACEYRKLQNGVIVSNHDQIQVKTKGRPGKRVSAFAKRKDEKCKNETVCIIKGKMNLKR